MSTGNFLKSKCENVVDTKKIYSLRVQKETTELDVGGTKNSPPTGNVTEGVKAKVSKSRREFGYRPPILHFEWAAGPPSGYEGEGGSLPLLTKAVYEKAIVPNAKGKYLNKDINVVSVSPQYF